jgi:hypothetical protein
MLALAMSAIGGRTGAGDLHFRPAARTGKFHAKRCGSMRAPALSGAGKTYFEARRPWDAVEPFE